MRKKEPEIIKKEDVADFAETLSEVWAEWYDPSFASPREKELREKVSAAIKGPDPYKEIEEAIKKYERKTEKRKQEEKKNG